MAGDILPDIAGLDLSFRPEMGAMVPLALPSNLPLDFLADNENYSAILPSIAPSVQLQPDFSLPQITAGDAYIAGPTAKEQQRASTTTIPGDSLPPPPPSSSTSAPPPPPPPPPASVPSNVPLIAPPVSTAISTEDFGVPPDAPAVEVDKPAAAPRNNLLAAIEDGGLKNLRKRNTDDDDQSNAPGLRKKTLAPKEDFMQDFKKKMMQRSK